MPDTDRLERLTDLVLVLLAAPRPLTLDAIADEVPGYPALHDARRQAFERDKRLLRDDGIPILAEAVGEPGQYGYRIDPASFYLPDLALTPEEQAALHLAVAGVDLGDPSGRHALLKLGATGLAEVRPVASVVVPAGLPALFDAVRDRAEVTFGYRGQARRVAPAGLWFRSGRWYLVGWDGDREAARTFRVDRVDGVLEAAPAGSASLPAGFDPTSAVPDPARAGEGDEGDALVEVDMVEAARVVAEVGEAAVVSRRPDGSVCLRLGVSNTVAFRSWLLGLLDHAWITGPANLREQVVAWLQAVADADPDPDPDHRAGRRGTRSAGATIDQQPTEAGVGRARPGAGAAARLRRLLAVVGWLARVGEAPIDEVADRFGMDRDELVRELELAACCGVPPYTPDVLMEIVLTDQTVTAFLPSELARPRRLTPAEGFALAAAARTILAVPGADHHGPLAQALAKLEEVLGSHRALEVSLDDPVRLSDVQSAVSVHQQLEIEYHSVSADEVTRRVVDPIRVVNLEGHWYLDAYCHRAGGERRFRVDRVRALAPSGQPGGPAAATAPGLDRPDRPDAATAGAGELVPFVAGPGATMVRVVVGGDASWLADSVPVRAVEPTASGELLVTLWVGGQGWLARLLLQMGAEARVVEPASWRTLGSETARRVLVRYAKGKKGG